MKLLTNEKIESLRQNARSMVRELGLLNDAYFNIGVTLAERHLLIELMSCSCPTMGEIANRLLLDKSTASRLIAKAIKKGYVQLAPDPKDKRKKFIHLTELGKKTFNTFEPIAFHQTKEALLTLPDAEIEMVFKGIDLFAQGLKKSRLKGQQPELVKDARAKLAQLGYSLKPYAPADEEGLCKIFQEVVDAGNQFPYESSSRQEFHRQFLGAGSQVYVVHSNQGEVVGGFFIKPNFSGRAEHIANAAYMIKGAYRGKGLGTLLVKASLEIAKNSGFQQMQFNLVLSQNLVALKLYEKLGFTIIGTIPRAIRNADGSYQQGHILLRELDDGLLTSKRGIVD